MQKLLNLAQVMVCFSLLPSLALAQLTPSQEAAGRADAAAGAAINALPALPAQLTPSKKQDLEVAKPAVVGQAPDTATIRLSGFESDIENDAAGYRLVSKYFPMQLTQEEWKRVSNEIWEGYRAMDKLVRVDLVLDHNEFIVSISQLRIHKITFSGSDGISEKKVRRIEQLAQSYISEGQLIDLFLLKKFLLRMDYRAQETVTTKIVSADGESVDINFSVAVRSKANNNLPWQISVDNYGSQGFGRYRGLGRYSAPLFSAGDNFAVQVLGAEGQEFASARYDFPIGYLPLRGSVWASLLHYQVKGSAIDQTGRSFMTGIDFSSPFFFRHGGLVTSSLGYEFKKTKDSVLDTRKWINNLHLRAAGENFLGGRLTFGGDAQVGNLYLGDGLARFIDNLSKQAEGNFAKFYGDFQFLQPLTARSSVSLNVKGQVASKNLDSLEKFYFGGSSGVRAYSSDVGAGDEGVLASLAYSFQLPVAWPMRLSAFYDYATGVVSHRPWDSSSPNHFQMDAVGLQLTTGSRHFVFNASLAHPVSKSEVDSDQKWRLWAQAVFLF